jgi:hypothetical protein
MATETKATNVLYDAELLLSSDRHAIYGDALHDFRRIGEVWAALLNLPLPVPAHTVGAMLAGMKLVRSQITPEHRDSWVDAAAYCALGHGCVVTETAP